MFLCIGICHQQSGDCREIIRLSSCPKREVGERREGGGGREREKERERVSSPSLKFTLFADDTNVFYSGDDIQTMCECISRELDKLHVWLSVNKLSLLC